jgi:hypothetical protein
MLEKKFFESKNSDVEKLNGKEFKIIRPLTEEEADLECRMYRIELESGEIIDAYEDEIFKMRTMSKIDRFLRNNDFITPVEEIKRLESLSSKKQDELIKGLSKIIRIQNESATFEPTNHNIYERWIEGLASTEDLIDEIVF